MKKRAKIYTTARGNICKRGDFWVLKEVTYYHRNDLIAKPYGKNICSIKLTRYRILKDAKNGTNLITTRFIHRDSMTEEVLRDWTVTY